MRLFLRLYGSQDAPGGLNYNLGGEWEARAAQRASEWEEQKKSKARCSALYVVYFWELMKLN